MVDLFGLLCVFDNIAHSDWPDEPELVTSQKAGMCHEENGKPEQKLS